MVLQPLATAGFAVGRTLIAPLRGLVTIMQPVGSIIITRLHALADSLQPVWSWIVNPLRALGSSLAGYLQLAWQIARFAVTTMATHTARRLEQIQDMASCVFSAASESRVRLAEAAGSAATWMMDQIVPRRTGLGLHHHMAVAGYEIQATNGNYDDGCAHQQAGTKRETSSQGGGANFRGGRFPARCLCNARRNRFT